MQAGTIDFTLKNSSGGMVAATVAYNSSTDTATLTPSAALAYWTTYTATISAARSQAGDAMTTPVTWSFTSIQPEIVTLSGVQPVFNKRHLVTQIRIIFSGEVSAMGASEVGVYRLATAGKRGSFAAKNSKTIKIRSAVYDTVHDVVSLTPMKPFSLSKTVQLLIATQPPSGLVDSLGRSINGGSNVIALIGRHGVVCISAVTANPFRMRSPETTVKG